MISNVRKNYTIINTYVTSIINLRINLYMNNSVFLSEKKYFLAIEIAKKKRN